MKAGKKNKIQLFLKISMLVIFLVVAGIIAFRIWKDDSLHWYERVERKIMLQDSTRDVPSSPLTPDYNRDYGESGFQKITENESYILYADLTTGEICVEDKSTQKKWYSNPVDIPKENKKGAQASQLLVTLDLISINFVKEFNTYDDSVRMGGMEHEILENGIKFSFTFPEAAVIVPVQYYLCEDGFIAEVLTGEIQELWTGEVNELWKDEGAELLSVKLLPYFGAGGASDEGYLFIPDGSGALIEFNSGKQQYKSYEGRVYGEDRTSGETGNGEVTQSIRMPVFGLKCNEDALLAVITSGEGESSIYTATSNTKNAYNQVYSGFNYRLTADGVQTNTGNSNRDEKIQVLGDGINYSVKYMFLDSKEADYSGMSQKYQEYLKAQNMLKQSALAEDNYVILDIYGAVTIEKMVMGVNTSVLTALTGYADVCEIVADLKNQGVENIIINYIGALNGGFESKIVNKAKPENCLGTKREFNEMIEYLNEEGVLLFVETNPICIYEDGNGYKGRRDGAKTFFDEYAFQYNYTLDTHKIIEEKRWYLLSPGLVKKQVVSFAESAVTSGLTNITLYGLGDSLYSDKDKGEKHTTRTDCLDDWTKAMDEITEYAEYLMVHGGNAYCMPYADVVTDVSLDFSDYDVEDWSIPFYQMTFGNEVVIGTSTVNASNDYRYIFLKAVETGSSLKFNLINAELSDLAGTDYSNLSTYSYALWKDVIVELSLQMQELSQQIKDQSIVEHRRLAEDVSLTVYESGIGVIVNFGSDSYQYQDTIVEGMNFLVVEGVK